MKRTITIMPQTIFRGSWRVSDAAEWVRGAVAFGIMEPLTEAPEGKPDETEATEKTLVGCREEENADESEAKKEVAKERLDAACGTNDVGTERLDGITVGFPVTLGFFISKTWE